MSARGDSPMTTARVAIIALIVLLARDAVVAMIAALTGGAR